MIGIRLEGKKEASLLDGVIRRLPPPNKVRISLNQISENAATPCVQVGDTVRVGEKIAAPAGPDSVALHASISGKVTAITRFPDPLHGQSEAVEIQSDQRDERLPEIGRERAGWQNQSAEEWFAIFKNSGLVELDPTGEPLHRKFLNAANAGVGTLILNACEPEPYVTSGYALAMAHPVEILKGAEILRRAARAEQVGIAVEENKLELAELFKSKIYFLKWKDFRVEMLPPLFPVGDPQILVRELAKKNSANLANFKDAVVTQISTAFSVNEAMIFQKPLYERVVTIAGECVAQPKNLWARVGTSFGDLIKSCRGLLREPRKIVMGGPMKGIAQLDLETPIVKSTDAVLAIPKEVAKPEEVEPCIRCSRCVEACPVEISPAMITLAAERDLFNVVQEYGVEFCIECGNCAYVCPAKRPMVELIRYGARGVASLQEKAFLPKL